MNRRRAGRVILRDPEDAVLLARATIGDEVFWFTPGGGSEAGETLREAATRETAEETGIAVDLDHPPVLHRRAQFVFLGHWTEQVETFWLVDLDHRPSVVSPHLEDYEAESIDAWRWWAPGDLAALAERHDLYPRCLAALLDHVDHAPTPVTPWVEEHLSTSEPTLTRPDDPAGLPGWVRGR